MADETIRIITDQGGAGDKPPDDPHGLDDFKQASIDAYAEFQKSQAIPSPIEDPRDSLLPKDKELERFEEALSGATKEVESLDQSTEDLLKSHSELVNQSKILEAESRKTIKGRKKLNEGTEELGKNVEKSGKSSAMLARQTANLARASGAIGSNANQLVAAGTALVAGMGSLTLGLAGLFIAIGLTVIAIKSLNNAAESIAEEIGGFSGEVAEARARRRIAEIEDKIRLGQEVGGRAADFIDATTEMSVAIRELKRDILTQLLPIGTLIARAVTSWLDFVQWVKGKYIELFTFLNDKLSGIPIIGDFVNKILNWLTKPDDPYRSVDINQNMIDFFDPKRVGFDRGKPTKFNRKGARSNREIDLQDKFDDFLGPPGPPPDPRANMM